MKLKLYLSILIVCMLLSISIPMASAPPSHPCEPWPECKGGGSGEPPADPTITYRIGDSIGVMNADGSNQAVVFDPEDYPYYIEVFGGVSWSPDGATLAFSCYYEGAQYGLFLLDVTVVDGVPQGSGFRQIVSDEDCNACFNPAWSPTGDEIAVERNPNFVGPTTIFVVSPEGGPVETIYSLPYGVGILQYATWSSDGTRLAFWEKAYGVYSIKILDRASLVVTHTLLEGQFATVSGLDWARQGVETLAFSGGGIGTQSVDINTGEVTFLVKGSWPSWSPDNSKIAILTWKTSKLHFVSSFDITSGEITQLVKGGYAQDWKR